MPPSAGRPPRPSAVRRRTAALAAVLSLVLAVGAVAAVILSSSPGRESAIVAAAAPGAGYASLLTPASADRAAVSRAAGFARAARATAAAEPPAGSSAAPAASGTTTAGAPAPSTTAATPAPATPGPAAPATDPLVAVGLPSAKAWAGAVARTRSWVRGQGARIRVALMVDGHTWSFRGQETTHSNSLIKATVLVAYLRRASVRGRSLTAGEKALLSPMIRESANAPVNTLIGMMGGLEPLRRVGRLVGMRSFRPVSGLWGASLISAVDEARLFARLYSVLPPRHRAYALGLLGSIVPAQRWGMPRAAPRGWNVRFKSGWNGTGRVVQAMRLSCKGHVVSVAVLVDGSGQGASQTAVERAGRRLLQPLRLRGAKACASVRRAG